MKSNFYIETQMHECPLVLNLADDSVRLGLDNVATIKLWMDDVSSRTLSELLYYSLKHFHENNGTFKSDRASLLKGFVAERLINNAMSKYSLRCFQISSQRNMDEIRSYINGGGKPSFCSEFESVAESIVRSIVLFDQSEPNVDGIIKEQESIANLVRGVIDKELVAANTLCYQSSSFGFNNTAHSVQQFVQLMILLPSEVLKPQFPFRELVDELLRTGGYNNEPVFLQDPKHLESYSNVALAVRNGSFDLAAYISKCTNSKPSMGVVANAIFDSFGENSRLNFDDMVQEAPNLTRASLIDMDAKIQVRSNSVDAGDVFGSVGDASFKEISVGDWALEKNTSLYESLTSGVLLAKADSTISNMPLMQKSRRGVL